VERCLYPGRRWRGLRLLFALYFFWFVLTSMRPGRAGGPMVIFICAVGVMMCALALVPGAASLKLNSQGFTVRYWFKEETYRWTDVKEFNLITLRYMGIIPVRRSVGFRFSESYGKRNIISRIAGAIAQFDRQLPDNYGMRARELLVLLESCRRQAVGVDANPYQVPWPAIEPK